LVNFGLAVNGGFSSGFGFLFFRFNFSRFNFSGGFILLVETGRCGNKETIGVLFRGFILLYTGLFGGFIFNLSGGGRFN
jgi:hypothetical protein